MALRSTVQAYVTEGPLSSAQWRPPLRLLCEEARRRGERPEQVLVALKWVLAELCGACGVPHGPQRTALMTHVVTLCIEEFFRGDAPAVAADEVFS